ncbi:hypothetical protein PtA15_9A119 [Puccinia triticina]|uniref:ubiquitinyl hydrolase 1 n=1 Tax=Puccinia triticina TaxID=208348 RepID=A0ABY7CS01_9BASI|nr:uncharacterized protein PtA15_9A119 [Puccinia triticina]WAQ87994.1 hypothetical protein PtA15_9A119 [Puccinia triticina]WAR60187.1 hypothetical protein PtB15_9B124 [Puccinia triticina]
MPTAPDGDSKRPEETSTSVYAGLANNASSNLCFLNSVIQALASTSDLEDYLQQLRATAEHAAGEPAGIVDGLLEIIAELNTPRDRRTVLRPTKFIECLRANNASSARLFNSNQQDAHELLVMILEAVEDEATCTLEDCLKEYTVLELLDDYMCRKCTLLNREREMKTELEACRSKRKRAELKNDLQSLSEAIKVHPEQELHPLLEHSLSPIWSPMSTKQTMFARPPRVLTVHVSRSTVMGEGHLTKNYCRLVFPELLILDRFTTTERLSARAEAPISRPPGAPSDRTPAVSYPYRLLALIVHQGTHLSGHYLTFRRSPQGSWWRLSDQDVDRCPVREALDSNPTLLIYQRLGDEDQPQL